MSHRNARLTPHGRLLLVQRVASGRPVAHVAKELGVSRQCAHRWVARHATDGVAGLQDRSSRPHRTPTRTGPVVEGQVIALREAERRGPDWLAVELGVPARTVSRILRRHQLLTWLTVTRSPASRSAPPGRPPAAMRRTVPGSWSTWM